MDGSKSLEEKYRKLSPKQHILQIPDAYVGSIDKTIEDRFVLDANKHKFELRSVEFVPAFFKIFDELLVNSRDAKVRDNTVKKIQVTIDRESGSICVQNDGNGLEVQIHGEHNVYVPELIFGHLLTSSNYDTNEKRLTGGKNGCKHLSLWKLYESFCFCLLYRTLSELALTVVRD